MAERLEYCSPATKARDRSVRPAFIWIPLLLIAGVLAAVIAPPKFEHGNARRPAAMLRMADLRDALYAFHADTGRYPTAAEGLAVLTQRQASGTGEAYVAELPRDPWGHDYIYSPVAANGLPFDIHSLGGPDVHTVWQSVPCPVEGEGR